jgi:hypothetical protein
VVSDKSSERVRISAAAWKMLGNRWFVPGEDLVDRGLVAGVIGVIAT